MANEKLYVKSPFPNIEGGDPLYIDRELGKIEIGFQKIESAVGGSAIDQDARDDISDLQVRVGTLEAEDDNSLALITEERNARIAADLVEATRRLELKAELDDNKALFLEEQTVRVANDEAFASQLTTLQTEFENSTASITDELTTISTATSALASRTTTLEANVELNTAGIMEERIARVTQDEALAASLTTLTANFNNNAATVNSNLLALANEDQALSQSITNLNAIVGENNANIYEELDALANKDEVFTQQVNTLTSKINSKVRTFFQANAPIGSLINPLSEGDLWFETDNDNAIYRYDGYNWVPTLDPIGFTIAAVTNEANARTTADAANAQAIQTVTTTLNGQTTTIQTLSESVDGVRGKWGVRINNNGAITGIELNSGQNATSEFKVQADKFVIAPQNGASVSPFYVEGNTTYIENAVIKNGSINQVVSTNFPGGSGYFAGNPVYLVMTGVPAGIPLFITVNGASCTGPGVSISAPGIAVTGPDGTTGGLATTQMQVVTSVGGNLTFECYLTSGFPGSVVIMALKK